MGDRITFSGLSTGIDFQAIVDVTIQAERRRIDLVTANQAEETAKLTAIRSFNGLLLGLLTSVNALSRQDSFQTQTATSSHESILSPLVTGNTAPGTHFIIVDQLAQAQQLASQGFADIDTTSIGTGAITVQVGSGATTTIDIDAGDNTLGGLRDAINNSDADVVASIINDGSASKPYRLLLTSTTTGAANTIDINTSLVGGTAPDFVNKLIDAVEVAEGNSSSYTGTATASGTYTGAGNQTFLVEIMAGGAAGAATFRYSTDGGQTFNDNGGTGFLTATAGTLMEDGVSISFTDSGTLTADDVFSIDTFVPTIQVAQDAVVTVGSSAGGGAPISLRSESNTVEGVIPGVTLDLLEANPTQTVRVTVGNDTEGVRAGIEGFVEAYNGVIGFLNQQLRYDSLTEEAGMLIGDPLLISAQNNLRRITTGLIPGLSTDTNRLAAIGITSVMETGKLVIDDAKLNSALASNLKGVADLFSTSSTTTDSDVVFLNATASTAINGGTFEVDITQAATRGTLQGTAIAGFPLTLTSSNNQIQLVVDGVESSVLTLAAQTYNTGDELATEIQALLNADSELAGRNVSVEFSGGGLLFTSSAYGSSSSIELGPAPENSAFDLLGLTGSTVTAGKDVAGTINGEAATGSGQILTGDSGNTTTDGLALLVTLSQGDVSLSEAEAEVTIVEGVGTRMKDQLGFLTDPIDGRVSLREDTLTRHIDDLKSDIQMMEDRLEEKRTNLIGDFARLEAALSSISSQGEFLLQQLASLPLTNSLSRGSRD